MSDTPAPETAADPVEELRLASPKVQRTLNLPQPLLERMRATVAWLNYEGPEHEPATLADFAALALAKEVLRVEAEYNDGKPFRKVRRQLRRGRPSAGPNDDAESNDDD